MAGTEEARLEALRRYEVLDTPPDGAFDRVTRLAAGLFGVPVALVSLVDEDRIWFKSRVGLDDEVEEIPRDPGLCASAIISDGVYLVEDARVDPRTLANPLVAGEFGLRFYAAAPLLTFDGYRLGTLCIIDRQPRSLSPEDQALLVELAGVVMDEMELRLNSLRLVAAERRLRRETHERLRAAEAVTGALQAALLPPRLPSIEGLELAAAYRPANSGVVGGDFYDVFQGPDGSWFVAIGDVCGKGPAAAAVTAAVRHGLRAETVVESDPADVLRLLNLALLAEPIEEDLWCTVALARLHRGEGRYTLRLASGGHPAPVVVRASGGTCQLSALGTVIGLDPDVEYHAVTTELGPGDTVVLFTDGVTEARIGSDFFGPERLRSVLDGARGRHPREVVGAVFDAMSQNAARQHDDIALVVIRVPLPGG